MAGAGTAGGRFADRGGRNPQGEGGPAGDTAKKERAWRPSGGGLPGMGPFHRDTPMTPAGRPVFALVARPD